MILINAIAYFALCWVIYTIIPDSLNYVKNNNIISCYIETMCKKCITFWITLAITFNPFIAAIAAFLAYILDKNDTTKL